jgi:hypothetical protein
MGKVCAVPYRDIQEEAPKAHCESCGGELTKKLDPGLTPSPPALQAGIFLFVRFIGQKLWYPDCNQKAVWPVRSARFA